MCDPQTLLSAAQCLDCLNFQQLLGAWAAQLCLATGPTPNPDSQRVTDDGGVRVTDDGGIRIVSP